MAASFLEQLVAEWYEYRGYFVRRNVFVGKRPGGGFEAELDVVAFHPEEKKLVHIEPSMDAQSWAKREERYRKKFAAGRKYIPKLFPGLNIPPQIDQIALLEFASTKNRKMLGGGRIQTVGQLLQEIFFRSAINPLSSRPFRSNSRFFDHFSSLVPTGRKSVRPLKGDRRFLFPNARKIGRDSPRRVE